MGERLEYISIRQHTGKLPYKKQYTVEKNLKGNNNAQINYDSTKKEEKER